MHAQSLVPQPRSIAAGAGEYRLPPAPSVSVDAPLLQPVRAAALDVLRAHGVGASIAIRREASDTPLGSEGYRLEITPAGITIAAHMAAGAFYAVQTLDELLPYRNGAQTVAALSIVDSPAFAWRGIHLDVSRHFFPVPVVERYIDVAAHFKLNVFHWHLTDDQGWRIQIKRYPRLTSIGSCRNGTMRDHDATDIDSHRYCGFYTQAQVREIVAYAKARYVTVVPEIEMPGHSDAAIAAYPWLSCTNDRIAVRETWGVSEHIYCPTDRTFTFLENVLTEVMALFPSTYIHTGGDEVPKTEWERSSAVRKLMTRDHLANYDAVQGYFDRRIEAFLRAHGRRMIGWDEILDGGVTQSAAVMAWQSTERGLTSIRAGHATVMSPDGILYFDALQGDANDEPDAIGGLTTPQMVYGFIPPAGAIGVQGNLWTEYIPTSDQLFYMLLPRMMALADIAWSNEQPRDWTAYATRCAAQFVWLTRHGYAFRIPNPSFALAADAPVSYANVSSSVQTVSAMTSAPEVTVSMTDDVAGSTIHYTLDGTTPTARSPQFFGPFTITSDTSHPREVRAVTCLPNGRTSTPTVLRILFRARGSRAMFQSVRPVKG